MKKRICIALIAFASQLHGYQYTDGSTFAFADILVWQLREGSADNWGQEIVLGGSTQSANILSVPFNWETGLRIGVGRNLAYDYWDATFSYTWFQTKASNQASVTNGGIYSPYLGNFFVNNTNGLNFGPTYYNANIQWNFFYNIFDLELGRSLQIDHFLKLRPFIGLKAGSINQDIYTTWQNPTTATTFTDAIENLENHFWGVGPSIGINTTWSTYKTAKNCFNIFGNFSGALMWGHWKFKDQYQNNTPTTITTVLSSISGGATMARALLGIEWDTCFMAQSRLTLRLGYEAQVWFDQIRYYSLNVGRLNNQMSLQGGVLGFCFYF